MANESTPKNSVEKNDAPSKGELEAQIKKNAEYERQRLADTINSGGVFLLSDEAKAAEKDYELENGKFFLSDDAIAKSTEYKIDGTPKNGDHKYQYFDKEKEMNVETTNPSSIPEKYKNDVKTLMWSDGKWVPVVEGKGKFYIDHSGNKDFDISLE